MSQIFYGSHNGYYSPEPPSSGYEQKPVIVSDSLGFRLVHEAGHYAGIANGNLWYCSGELAQSMYRQFHLPGGRARTVGIRLVWAREEE